MICFLFHGTTDGIKFHLSHSCPHTPYAYSVLFMHLTRLLPHCTTISSRECSYSTIIIPKQAEVRECPGFLRRVESLHANTRSLSEMGRPLVIPVSPAWNKLEHLIMWLLGGVSQHRTDSVCRSSAIYLHLLPNRYHMNFR